MFSILEKQNHKCSTTPSSAPDGHPRGCAPAADTCPWTRAPEKVTGHWPSQRVSGTYKTLSGGGPEAFSPGLTPRPAEPQVRVGKRGGGQNAAGGKLVGWSPRVWERERGAVRAEGGGSLDRRRRGGRLGSLPHAGPSGPRSPAGVRCPARGRRVGRRVH